MTSRGQTYRLGQSGEHYVVAELNRRGIYAVAFAGNMPDIDVLAMTPRGRTIYIQVKSQRGAGWPISINARHKKPNRNIVWVLVELRGATEPKYWMVPDAEMKAILQADYDKNPVAYESKAQFAQIKGRNVEAWTGRWDLLGCPA